MKIGDKVKVTNIKFTTFTSQIRHIKSLFEKGNYPFTAVLVGADESSHDDFYIKTPFDIGADNLMALGYFDYELV